ncbi:cell division topological specificity factor MinE [Brackiella oedipodis]|uniref:cell division topological specificity factor MinE n=1 Tax=Brackiella oedipodis TaxID=124225 RepID=UPI00048E0342|nr:cell division topological specificity factor MinE [Brackiella oedipodis]
MSFLKNLLGKKERSTSAQKAKERLNLALWHDGKDRSIDFLPALQKDLLAVISKYIEIDPNDIQVGMDNIDSYEVLQVKIEMDPDKVKAAKQKSQAAK